MLPMKFNTSRHILPKLHHTKIHLYLKTRRIKYIQEIPSRKQSTDSKKICGALLCGGGWGDVVGKIKDRGIMGGCDGGGVVFVCFFFKKAVFVRELSDL